MISFKEFVFYSFLSLLTFSGIYFSAYKNFSFYLFNDLIPQFTNSTYTEPGIYYKSLNSTHCIEKVSNAGAEISIITSPNYLKIYYNLPNITYIFEINDKNSKIYTQTNEIICEKIENSESLILKVRNKYGFYEASIVNGSVIENLNGIGGKLKYEGYEYCKKLLEGKLISNIIENILNISSCFNLQRII